jgi:hypothetical protein
MKRRNFLTLALASLLPLPFVAKKKWYPIPPPLPLYERFSFTVRELGERYDIEGNVLLPCFRAVIRDGSKHMVIQSTTFTNTRERRMALDGLYHNIGYVTRRRQFPKDTLIYDRVDDEPGYRLCNPRYPV